MRGEQGFQRDAADIQNSVRMINSVMISAVTVISVMSVVIMRSMHCRPVSAVAWQVSLYQRAVHNAVHQANGLGRQKI